MNSVCHHRGQNQLWLVPEPRRWKAKGRNDVGRHQDEGNASSGHPRDDCPTAEVSITNKKKIQRENHRGHLSRNSTPRCHLPWPVEVHLFVHITCLCLRRDSRRFFNMRDARTEPLKRCSWWSRGDLGVAVDMCTAYAHVPSRADADHGNTSVEHFRAGRLPSHLQVRWRSSDSR